MLRDQRLENFLETQGIKWSMIPASRHQTLENEWEAHFGGVWRLGMRHRSGGRAQDEYARRQAEQFLIVPFLGDHAGPISVGVKSSLRTAAYECNSTGKLPDLSVFCEL